MIIHDLILNSHDICRHICRSRSCIDTHRSYFLFLIFFVSREFFHFSMNEWIGMSGRSETSGSSHSCLARSPCFYSVFEGHEKLVMLICYCILSCSMLQ